MDDLHAAYKALFGVLDQLRLTGPERQLLVGHLQLLHSAAEDRQEEKMDGGAD